MTQVIRENGELIPVNSSRSLKKMLHYKKKKTVEVDGYNAIQVGFEDKKHTKRCKI